MPSCSNADLLRNPAVFTNWWTTLTFLLTDAPYRYNTLEIGLFGLVGLFGVCIAPFTGKLLDRMEGWFGQLAALAIQVSFLYLPRTLADGSRL